MNTINYSDLPNSKITPGGQVAWSASELPLLMDYVIEKGWIVLGGDVLTLSGNYTYDNWCYDPNRSLSLTQNIHKSVTACINYVDAYTKRNGTDFLFSLVISNTFLDSSAEDNFIIS